MKELYLHVLFPELHLEIETWKAIWDATKVLNRGLMWTTNGIGRGHAFTSSFGEWNHMALMLVLCDRAQSLPTEEKDSFIENIKSAVWNIADTLIMRDTSAPLANSLSTKKVKDVNVFKTYAQRAINLGVCLKMAHGIIG